MSISKIEQLYKQIINYPTLKMSVLIETELKSPRAGFCFRIWYLLYGNSMDEVCAMMRFDDMIIYIH